MSGGLPCRDQFPLVLHPAQAAALGLKHGDAAYGCRILVGTDGRRLIEQDAEEMAVREEIRASRDDVFFYAAACSRSLGIDPEVPE